MREYVGPPRQATHVTFVPGDPPRLAAIAHQDAHSQSVYLWRLDRPDPRVLSWTTKTAWSEPLLAASPDGRWLVAGGGDRSDEAVYAWDLTADPPASPAVLPGLAPMAVRFTGTANDLTAVSVIAMGGGNVVCAVLVGTFSVKEPPTDLIDDPRIELPMTVELADRVLRMSRSDWRLKSALSNDGQRLAVAPREVSGEPLAREAFIWDIGSGQPPRVIATSGHPCAMAFSPDGSRMVIDVGTVYVYDTTTLEVVASWKAKYSAPNLAWSPDGRLLARTDISTTVCIYVVATGRQVLAVGGKRGRLTSVAFSPDGLMLATGTHTGPIRVWDVE